MPGTVRGVGTDALQKLFNGEASVWSLVIDGTGAVYQPAAVAGSLTCTGPISGNNGLAIVAGGASIGGATSITGTFSASALITAQSGLTITGLTTFNGAITAAATAFEIADPGNAGAIPVTTSGVVNMTSGASPETRTLASPTFQGQTLLISLAATGGGNVAITASAAINQAGNTVMTFSNQDVIKLEANRSGGSQRWQVTANDGVALS